MSTQPLAAGTFGESNTRRFLHDVVQGLSQPQKNLPCKYFYDAEGSALFDQICSLPEYYPTRTELSIMESHAPAMADGLGEECVLIEFGSGSSQKTRVLLDALCTPYAYVPIDISFDCLHMAADALRLEYPKLHVLPVWADYTEAVDLPASIRHRRGRAVYFPGSTIGNFHPPSALAFLQRIADLAGPGGAVLIGIDLRKDPRILERAYNDTQGATAAFNKNVLARINRELDGNFDLDGFAHFAVYNPQAGRIEMHLMSVRDQTVRFAGAESIGFRAGESIRTECSYKYTVEGFAGLALGAGLTLEHVWSDRAGWFAVLLLRVRL